MKAVRFTARSVPFAFALITLVAYGLLVPFTGFYWDDWPFAWIARFLGPSEFLPAFEGFRPFLGPLFFLTTSLLPIQPIAWQILALIMRVVAAWAAWFALQQAWPRTRAVPLIAAFLFLIFPGYSQHWVALTHINQEWISLIAYLCSIGLSLRAVRHPGARAGSVMAALLLQAVGLLPTEYFIGLEPLRFLLVLLVVSEPVVRWRARLLTALKAWLPYLVLWLLNAAWLIYYYRSGLYISYDTVAVQTAPSVSSLVLVLVDAIWKVGFYVWLQIVPLVSAAFASPTSVATIALAVASLAALGLYLSRLDIMSTREVPSDSSAPTGPQVSAARPTQAWLTMLIGLLGLLLGRIPSWAAGLPLTLQSSFDRLTISMMLGASLFVAGLLLLIPSNRIRTGILAALLALGIGQQFWNANIFRRDWERQQDIYWQMAWRMPALRPNTAILAQQMPLDYETDLAMTAALNWMYASEVTRPNLPYAVIYTEKRLGGAALPALQPGLPIRLPFRTLQFNGNTSQVVVVEVPTSGCLRVFDPADGSPEIYPRLPESIAAAIPLSDPDLISTNAAPKELPAPPFDREPSHGWCYFYEKAELARQIGDWEEVMSLHASGPGQPEDALEWFPFIEAEARAGDQTWARQKSLEILASDRKLERGLCALWTRVQSSQPGGAAPEVLAAMGCTQ